MNLSEETTLISERAKKKLTRDLGEDVLCALHDQRTVEIMLNANGNLWQERLGEPMRCIGSMRSTQALGIVKTVAGFHGRELTRFNPTLECEFPLDGSRFAAQVPPVVSEVVFAIRKKAVSVFTLDDYVAAGIMTAAQCGHIKDAVVRRRDILVIGGTGSGKTTLINAVIEYIVAIEPKVRIVIIEDTGEIQCTAKNYIQYHTSSEVSMTQLLRTTLRMRPDRIIVGEVRGPEALDLLMAWNTGHEGGVATLHANDARCGLSRLAMLISMHPDSPKPIEPLIGDAVHLIVHIARTAEGRRVEEIMEVLGYENGRYLTETFRE